MTGLMPTAVALTFESAGDPAPTLPILEVLKSADVNALFFIDGQWASANPDLVRRIASDGHAFGNHGFQHPDWTTMSDEEIRADLRETEVLIDTMTGRQLKPWARPPYGAVDDRVLAVLQSAGYHAVYRDAVDGGHWPGETNADSIFNRALQSAANGDVIVFHTNRPETVEALPRIIESLKEAGIRLVSLSDLPAIPPARPLRHPDFSDLSIQPGYLRPKIASSWQSMNVLELGALLLGKTNASEPLVNLADTTIALITGDSSAPMGWIESQGGSFILVMAGELRCEFRTMSSEDAGYLVARPGDLFQCPPGMAYRLGPSSEYGRRWIALRWRPHDPF